MKSIYRKLKGEDDVSRLSKKADPNPEGNRAERRATKKAEKKRKVK